LKTKMTNLSSLIKSKGFPSTFAVRGVTKEPFKDRLKSIHSGLPVSLEKEPDNPHDPNAIKVIAHTGDRAIHIGYVPREINVIVGEVIDKSNEGGIAQHWKAHISELLKSKEDDSVGVLVIFFCDRVLPRQKSKIGMIDNVG